VWHASVSVWSPDGMRQMNMPRLALKEAVGLLAGVGGEHEWWTFGTGPAGLYVGYLRVAMLETEYSQCPAGVVTADAGEAGARRPRSYPGSLRGKA
jgi:hypothetical protein